MPRIKIPALADSFTGPVPTGEPSAGIRAELVAAAVLVAEALLIAELDQQAAVDAVLDEAFGPIGGGS